MILYSPLLSKIFWGILTVNSCLSKSRDSARHSRLAQSREFGICILLKTTFPRSEKSPKKLEFAFCSADSNPSKSRAEFCSRAEFSSEAEQNSADLHSCEGEGLISAHLGSWDDPTKSSRKAECKFQIPWLLSLL